MTFKDALQCLYDLLGRSVDDQQSVFLKYLYEAAAEIGNSLDLCKECIEGELEPMDCKIVMPDADSIKSVELGQVMVGSFDLHPASMSKVKALKNATQNPTWYHWDCNKPEELTFAPSLKKWGKYLIDIVRKVDPTKLTCDDEIWDGKSPELHHLIYQRAAIRAAFSCEEPELGAQLNELYQQSLQNALESFSVPSIMQRLKSVNKVDPQSRMTVEELT